MTVEFDIKQQEWRISTGDQNAFRAWLTERLDANDYETLTQGLRCLETRYSAMFANIVLEMERENPYRVDQSDAERDQLPVSRLLNRLIDGCTPTLARILDDLGVRFREYEYLDRAMDHFQRLSEEFQRRADLVPLGRSWMWQGRIHTELSNHESDLPCYQRAISILQYVYADTNQPESTRREAAWAMSSVQHQLAVKCQVLDQTENALLLNMRSLALRDKLDSDRLRSGSYHNIAINYEKEQKIGLALLHYMRSVKHDTLGAGPHERRITYYNMARFARKLGEPRIALLFCDKSDSLGMRETSTIYERAASLFALERYDDAIQSLVDGLAENFLSDDYVVPMYQLLLIACDKALRNDEAAVHRRQLVDWVVEQAHLEALPDEGAREIAQAMLEKTDAFETRAVLCCAIDQRDRACKELERAISNATDQSKRQALMNLQQQIRNESENTETAVTVRPSEEPRGIQVCQACGRQQPVSGHSKNGDLPKLCADCREAAELEDLVIIAAGIAWLPDDQKTHVPAFQIDLYPVTNRLFKIYYRVSAETWEPENWSHALYCHPDQPMTCANVSDMQSFCRWRSKLSGWSYQLPTTEQWLRAALGDDGRKFPWGNQPPDYELASYSLFHDRDAFPPPVGLYPKGASPFGVMEMAGGVWEVVSSLEENGDYMYLGGACDSEPYMLEPKNIIAPKIWAIEKDGRGDMQLGFRCVASRGPGSDGAI